MFGFLKMVLLEPFKNQPWTLEICFKLGLLPLVFTKKNNEGAKERDEHWGRKIYGKSLVFYFVTFPPRTISQGQMSFSNLVF